MMIHGLLGLSLVLTVAFERNPTGPSGMTALTPSARNASVQPTIRRATECVAKYVAGDAAELSLSDKIVKAMPDCAELMRAMIEAFDREYGNGVGETYFSGPYLDSLPAAVHKLADELRR